MVDLNVIDVAVVILVSMNVVECAVGGMNGMGDVGGGFRIGLGLALISPKAREASDETLQELHEDLGGIENRIVE